MSNLPQHSVAQKKELLLAHMPEARRLFRELKINQDPDYLRIVGQRTSRIDTYIEEHYVKGAMFAFETTSSMKVALAFLYHGLEGGRIESLKLAGELAMYEPEVKGMLRNYYEIESIEKEIYTAADVNRYFPSALLNKEQYATRFVDIVHRLALSEEMHTNIDRKGLARRVFMHAHLIKNLGFSTLSATAFNIAFPVVAPRACSSIEKKLYGGTEKGRSQLEAIKEGIEIMLNDFLAENRIEGRAEVRWKNPFSIYRKIVERMEKPGAEARSKEGLTPEAEARKKKTTLTLTEGLEVLEKISDLVAARIVLTGADNRKSSVYEVQDLLEKHAGFFRYADPESTYTGRNYRDYVKNPPEDRPYQSIHMTADFAKVAAGYRGIYGVKLYDDRIALALKLVELQVRTEDMHQMAEFGLAAHGKYKMKNLSQSARTVADMMSATVEQIHDAVRISKPVRIVVIEEREAEEITRLNPPEYETMHHQLHLTSKIVRSVQKVFGKAAKMDDLKIDPILMDKIATSESSDIRVYVSYDAAGNSVAITKILKAS